MAFLDKPSRTLYCVLLGMLLLQMLFLALTLTPNAEGLAWAARVLDCDSFTRTAEFFSQEICLKADDDGDRVCSEYEDACSDSGSCNGAKEDYNAAGGLAAFNLTFTLILLILVALLLGLGEMIPVCGQANRVFNVSFIVINTVLIIFAIAAAGVAGDSDALEETDSEALGDCDETIGGTYGVGIMAFLVFWMLAQVGMVAYPCGALVDTTSSSSGAGFGTGTAQGSSNL